MAVFYPTGGTWNVRRSSNGTTNFQLGYWPDLALATDYDGDGKADIATYYPAGGLWYVLKSSGGMIQQNWGWSQAVPVTPPFQISRHYFPAP